MASFFESKSGKKIMAMAYGIGAAIVIVGALFKIMHWTGANEMLILGMGTEALIFFISAFEPIHEEWDWSLVYPELAGMEGDDRGGNSSLTQGDAVSQQLDKMLAEAKIGPELIEGLGSGLKSLSSNVSSMADLSGATIATKEYAENVTMANEQLRGMNSSYGRAVSALDSLSETTESSMADLSGATIATKEYAENVTMANEQLRGMNSSYGRAVSALDSLSETTESFKETTGRVASINATLNDSLVSFDQNIQNLNKVYGGMLNAMRPNS